MESLEEFDQSPSNKTYPSFMVKEEVNGNDPTGSENNMVFDEEPSLSH